MPIIISGSQGETILSGTGSLTQGPAGALPVVITGSLTVSGSNTIVNYGSFISNESGYDHDFRVESLNMTHTFFVDGGTEAVSIGNSTNAPEGVLEVSQASNHGLPALVINAADVDENALHIAATQTTANIIDIEADDCLTTGKALFIDHNDGATAAVTPTTFHIDFDKDGVTANSTTSAFIGIDLDMNDAATNHAGSNVTMTGLDIDVDSASTQGTNTNVGIDLTVIDATTNDGIRITAENGAGSDIKIMSSADATDYCTVAVGAAGATTITTVDTTVGATAHLTMTVDGGIKLDGAGVEIENDSTTGAPALLIDNDDTDQIALNIVAANIDANVINITANALTSGDGISVASSTTDTTARALLKLSNSNSAAVATIPIEIVQADVAEGDIISAAVGANGSICALRVKEASVTCSTSDVTTESSNFFPALSIPVALGIRVTTAITNNAFVKKIGWEHDANAFAGSDDGSRDMSDGELEAAGTTTITAGGMNLVFHEASDLLITHNATPGAGVLRIAYYYYSITAPTS